MRPEEMLRLEDNIKGTLSVVQDDYPGDAGNEMVLNLCPKSQRRSELTPSCWDLDPHKGLEILRRDK